ncbi:MAG: 4-hydroxy-3-methylbut-2-enyl diphosphate reductase [Planctomycetota bacterium]
MSETRYTRRGFGFRAEVHKDVEREFDSRLVQQMKEQENRLSAGGLTFRLAREFGFCYGVDRAVDYAYETRRVYPDRRILLMGEIIHNPVVNQRLSDMDIPIVADPIADVPDLGEDDVVIIPAFGLPSSTLDKLKAAGPVLVDTTCGSVLVVWKNVSRYAKSGFTSIIHGKWYHEETKATASQALLAGDGRYLVVLNLEDADHVCEYILGRGDREEFLARFVDACSPGFDPDTDLSRIGMANQTTMLASESIQVADRFRTAMAERFGEDALDERFIAFDTICSATQERQDALQSLLGEPLDLALIVGGYNSSNTGHLARIASRSVPTYHIQHAGEIGGGSRIRHRDPKTGEIRETTDWLPDGEVTIGLTAGASTPNLEVGRVVRSVLECRGVTIERT